MHWFDFFPSLLSQTDSSSTSSLSAAEQIELLKIQIEFLQDANSHMAKSFSQYVTLINSIFVSIGILIGILGFRTRQEIKQSLNELVQNEINQQIAKTVKTQIDEIERIIQREALVEKTRVDYLSLVDKNGILPQEYQLLKSRGFQIKMLFYDSDRTLPQSDVIVLDLLNSGLSEERQEEKITEIQKKVLEMPTSAVLVIYVRGRRKAVDNFPRNIYYIPANSIGTLVGAVANAGEVAYALCH